MDSPYVKLLTEHSYALNFSPGLEGPDALVTVTVQNNGNPLNSLLELIQLSRNRQ